MGLEMEFEDQVSIADVHLENPCCFSDKGSSFLLLVYAWLKMKEACRHLVTYKISFHFSEIYTHD